MNSPPFTIFKTVSILIETIKTIEKMVSISIETIKTIEKIVSISIETIKTIEKMVSISIETIKTVLKQVSQGCEIPKIVSRSVNECLENTVDIIWKTPVVSITGDISSGEVRHIKNDRMNPNALLGGSAECFRTSPNTRNPTPQGYTATATTTQPDLTVITKRKHDSHYVMLSLCKCLLNRLWWNVLRKKCAI